MRRLRLSGVRPKRIGVHEAEAPLAPCGQKQLVSLRAKPIDLADDFTGMLEAFLDLPQQFLLFVVRHIPPSEVAFPNAPPTHRPSNWEVTASTERMHGLRVTDLTVTRYLTDLAEFCVNQNAAMTNRRFPAPWSRRGTRRSHYGSAPLSAALVYTDAVLRKLRLSQPVFGHRQPRWCKHPYLLPETLIQVAQPVSAMLKIICIKLIPWDGVIDAFTDQKTGASRHDSGCNYRVLRLVAGAAGVCQLGRGRFEADCKPV
jgi:hypothetical protein